MGQRSIAVGKGTQLLTLAAIALGALLGYGAAAGKFRPGRASADPRPAAGEKAVPDKLDRTVLPIPEPKYRPITEVDARKAKAPPRFEVKAPKWAPNVVIVLIDDMGFGQSS